jgi:hypothetical protein
MDRDRRGRLVLEKGPAWTAERALEALRIEHGLPPTKMVDQISVPIPAEVIAQLNTRIERAKSRLRSRFMRGASEERLTDQLFTALEGTFEVDGWRVDMRVYDYSSVAKENVIGADVGVVVDIISTQDNREMPLQRVVKGLWFQSKIAVAEKYSVEQLPRLSEQLDLMREFTSEGYAAIYTPEGVDVYDPKIGRTIDLEDVLDDAFRCTRGDRRPSMLVNSMDSRLVFEALLTFEEQQEHRRRWRI